MIGVFSYTVVLTYLGFISGIVGIIFGFNGNAKVAVICLLLSGLCELFDDRVAKTKKDRTKFEKDFCSKIDILNDIVTFGILPIIVGLCLNMSELFFIPVYAIYALAGLVRLGYLDSIFNGKNNETELVGLQLSLSAIIIPLLYLIRRVNGFIYLYPLVLLILSFLYISKIKFPKLKNKELFVLLGIGIIEFVLVLVLR